MQHMANNRYCWRNYFFLLLKPLNTQRQISFLDFRNTLEISSLLFNSGKYNKDGLAYL